MSTAHTPIPSRRGHVLRGAAGFLIVLAIAATFFVLKQRGGASASDANPSPLNGAAGDSVEVATAAPAAAGDSIQAAIADSAAADSSQAGRKGGLFAFLRRGPKKQEPKQEKREAVPVETAPVCRADVPSFFVGTGNIEAEQRAAVLAKIAGTVQAIHVEEGTQVSENQVLLQIDDREERARLLELKVRAESLERDYERTRSLFEEDLTSQRELDDKKLLVDEAKAKLLVGEIQTGYTQVHAPFSGRITERLVHVGEHVQVNQQLFSIADFDPLLVRVFLPEREANRIRVGQEVQVISNTASDDTEFVCAGRVRLVAPVVDTRSGTVKVTVELGERSSLRIGAFVRVQITTDIHQDALVVPKLALREEGGETYVYRCEADSVVKVRVQTGYVNGTNAEVLVGLENGDRVVTVGHGGLKHGTRVRDVAEPKAVAVDSTRAASGDDAADVARR